jgi:uncharacterized protein
MDTPHFILYVRDQEQAASFYRAVLAREPRLNVPGMTEFALGAGAVLGLMPESGASRLLGTDVSAGHPRCEIYLLGPGAAERHARALSAGAVEISAMSPRDWGHRAAYSLDPDGHVLAFAEES